MTEPDYTPEAGDDLERTLDKLFLDWFDDVLHARHLEQVGFDPPPWMRAGWGDPRAAGERGDHDDAMMEQDDWVLEEELLWDD